jgi:hypothetical protein
VDRWQGTGWRMSKPAEMPELNQYHGRVVLRRAIASIKKRLTNGTQICRPVCWHSIYVQHEWRFYQQMHTTEKNMLLPTDRLAKQIMRRTYMLYMST